MAYASHLEQKTGFFRLSHKKKKEKQEKMRAKQIRRRGILKEFKEQVQVAFVTPTIMLICITIGLLIFV